MEGPRKTEEPLRIDTALVEKILVSFIKDEVTAPGLSKAVVGLSGGVDSAVACVLAAKALGPENVLAVLLPYKLSGHDSIQDAMSIVEKFNMRYERVDITPMADPFIQMNYNIDKVRIGNVLARMRMIVLYDCSARENALVIGTSNKTEILLGYGTIFGDLASAINPIGDLYKSQVWELARALDIPEQIIEKPPTADLWQGQTDEDELGFTYKEVDKLLHYMIDERRTDEELTRIGFDKKMIANVREKIRKSQFKRRMPLIAKVSHRTVNVDFRYIRDWGQ